MAGKLSDPQSPDSFHHCKIRLPNGNQYHYIDEKPAESSLGRGTCVLLHGFPDLWYGWRYQIKALKEAGFRCLVPSALGYCGSSQPEALEAYGFQAQSNDLEQLLRHIGVEGKILLFGHDWGGLLAWRFAAYYPQRVASIAVVSTPYAPPAQAKAEWTDLKTIVKRQLPNFGYQLFFAEESAAELVQSNLEPFFGFIFGEVKPQSPNDASERSESASWVMPGVLKAKLNRLDGLRQRGELDVKKDVANDPELAYYIQTFTKHGIRHPLNYYKSRPVSFNEERASGLPLTFPSGIPVLFLTGTADEALPLWMSDRSSSLFEKGQYRRVVLQDADHWLLQRQKTRDIASSILVKWAQGERSFEEKQAKL